MSNILVIERPPILGRQRKFKHVCLRCKRGWMAETKQDHCTCGAEGPIDPDNVRQRKLRDRKKRKLGDALEIFLKRHGVTQSRYREIKKRFGMPPTCNCSARREYLNRVGLYLGIGK